MVFNPFPLNKEIAGNQSKPKHRPNMVFNPFPLNKDVQPIFYYESPKL